MWRRPAEVSIWTSAVRPMKRRRIKADRWPPHGLEISSESGLWCWPGRYISSKMNFSKLVPSFLPVPQPDHTCSILGPVGQRVPSNNHPTCIGIVKRRYTLSYKSLGLRINSYSCWRVLGKNGSLVVQLCVLFCIVYLCSSSNLSRDTGTWYDVE